MDNTLSLIEGVFIILALILLTVSLKKLGVLKKDDSGLFSRIVLQITLPAVIFSSLATKQFESDYLIMAGMMAIVELGMLLLAWGIATLLRFNAGEKGALMLVSAFGMTSLLGYPIIRQAFPGNPLAMEEAVITSEFGVGLLLFVIGPLIAMYYGQSEVQGKDILKSAKKFFVSPIFISLLAGIAFSFLPIRQDGIIANSIFQFLKFVGNANLLMVAFTIGLIIEFRHMNNIYLFLAMAVLLKLGIKPLCTVYLTQSHQFTDMMREIVFIETALPSAILTAVFAKQYNCRPDLVSMAIVVTLMMSVLSITLLSYAYF